MVGNGSPRRLPRQVPRCEGRAPPSWVPLSTSWTAAARAERGDRMDVHREAVTSTTPARVAGRYWLGEPLGRGRSTVFRAVDARLDRHVAIKRVELLAGEEDVERVRRRALREAQAAARLNNPRVVTVFDVVEEAGSIWLVMELVDAPSLAQVVVDGGPIPHRRAARIGLDVLTAL